MSIKSRKLPFDRPRAAGAVCALGWALLLPLAVMASEPQRQRLPETVIATTRHDGDSGRRVRIHVSALDNSHVERRVAARPPVAEAAARTGAAAFSDAGLSGARPTPLY